MLFTQKETLVLLKESGRDGWTLRQMTALRNEGFLPPLRRGTQQGTNRPLYVWDETDIDQIVDVYDWWSYSGGDRAALILGLWLQGYEVSPDFLRRTYIPIIEAHLQMLTHGKTDPDDILDEVSEFVVRWIRKLKYSPGLADQRKKMLTEQKFSIEQMEMLIETVLSALAVPDQELATEALQSPLLSARESLDTSTDYEEDEDVFAQSQDVAAILRDIFTLPNLLEVVNLATPEQWEQAREDYQTICRLLSESVKLSTNGDMSLFPTVFLRNLTVMGAVWLIAPLLSTRYRGYGQWIDVAFEKLDEYLTDPSIRAQALSMARARRMIQTDADDTEKPELSIQD